MSRATVVRTLESAALSSATGEVLPGTGATGLFITPGFGFQVVGALLTNFHLPRSTPAHAGLGLRRPRAGPRRV